jgi:hypothetical protein
VLKIDRDIAGSMGVKTGSDDALIVGEEGGAEYLELTGTSLESGIKLLNEQRRNALETAQCIVPDPADIAAQGISSVALKGIFGPMIGKCETLRDQYGKGMKRVLDQMTDVARAKLGQKTIIYVKNDAGEPEAQEVEFFIDLPAKVVETPQQSPDGQPVVEEDTGKPVVDTQKVELKPGDGGELELVWPEYFPATPADQAAVVTTLGTAAGGKPIISQQTAVEKTAAVYGVEPAEEWARVQKGNAEDKAAAAENAKAMGTDGDFAGGKPGADGMPEGAKPKPLAAPKFGGSKAPFGGKQDDDAGGDDDGGK